MQRHPTDLVALLFGLIFLAVGGGYVVHEAWGRHVDAVWVVAITMTAVGSAFLGVTLVRRRPFADDPDPAAPDDAPGS